MAKEIKRSDLKLGDKIMTKGEFDGVDLQNKIGTIIKIGEYGNLLIEFDEKFNRSLHSGHNNIGKAGQCFYIPLANILSNDPASFEKLKKSNSYYVDDKQWWFANRPKNAPPLGGKTAKTGKSVSPKEGETPGVWDVMFGGLK